MSVQKKVEARRIVRETVDVGLRRYFSGIYTYMALGLGLTAGVSVALGFAPIGVQQIFSSLSLFLGLGLVGLSFYAHLSMARWSVSQAQAFFWTYASVMGILMSSIFGIYHIESIARAFFITALTFGATSAYGHLTKRDLSSMGSLLIMGLMGIFLAMIVNMFLKSSAMHFSISILGVLIFMGLIAYETQSLKDIYYKMPTHDDMSEKIAIFGAFSLYLSVINIFTFLLNLFGERK